MLARMLCNWMTKLTRKCWIWNRDHITVTHHFVPFMVCKRWRIFTCPPQFGIFCSSTKFQKGKHNLHFSDTQIHTSKLILKLKFTSAFYQNKHTIYLGIFHHLLTTNSVITLKRYLTTQIRWSFTHTFSLKIQQIWEEFWHQYQFSLQCRLAPVISVNEQLAKAHTAINWLALWQGMPCVRILAAIQQYKMVMIWFCTEMHKITCTTKLTG